MMKRISRACVRCRKHKAKCILQRSQDILRPPCQRCIDAGVECVLATSNRGGSRRHRKPTDQLPSGAPDLDSQDFQRSYITLEADDVDYLPPEVHRNEPALQTPAHSNTTSRNADIESFEDTLAATDLHGTTNALNILSHIGNASSATEPESIRRDFVRDLYDGHQMAPNPISNEDRLSHYALVKDNHLTSSNVEELVERFATLYHHFYPIASARSMTKSSLSQTVKNEPNLLTAMITIAAKDIPGGDEIFMKCLLHMQRCITEIMSGKRCDVEAVEALLLLAEWEPQSSIPDSTENACGQEDMAAWMHIGLALRLAYALRLDRASAGSDRDSQHNVLDPSRERLAWIACYLSDRQISVRTGRHFACRGLGPSMMHDASLFPALKQGAQKDDYFLNVFRARLELSGIFSNVHEVLYCGMANSTRMVLGSYASYLDDYREAISAWKRIWGTLTCSHMVKILLEMSYEYLRLYTNAFVFQTTALRAATSGNQNWQNRDGEIIGGNSALPEARFIYESIDAAKALLTILNNYIPSQEQLNCLPIRFPLYCINAAVFLFKVWSMNIMSTAERKSTRQLIFDTIERLRAGSIRDTDLGSRYADLLKLLWEHTEEQSSKTTSGLNAHVQQPQEQPGYPQDLFSWLDLEALGDFVSGESGREPESGFSNLQHLMHTGLQGEPAWESINLPVGNDIARLF